MLEPASTIAAMQQMRILLVIGIGCLRNIG